MSVQEAAKFLDVSVSTIRRYIRNKQLPAYRIAGERILRIRRDELESLLVPLQERDVRDSEKVRCFLCYQDFSRSGVSERCEACGNLICPRCGACLCSLTPEGQRAALAVMHTYGVEN